MSQIKDAFQKAGYRPTEERLQEIALTTMVNHADNLEETMEEIWKRVSAKADADYEEYQAAWQRSAIGDCQVSGVPVWQVTPRTARLWAERQQKRWRIVEMLCDGLPDDGRHPIEYYRKPEEVAELWRRFWKSEDEDKS